MIKRFHLDTISRLEKTIWLTLVVEPSNHCYVEEYHDSRFKFLTGRLKVIRSGEFKRHMVNRVPLAQLVATKLSEMNLRGVL